MSSLWMDILFGGRSRKDKYGRRHMFLPKKSLAMINGSLEGSFVTVAPPPDGNSTSSVGLSLDMDELVSLLCIRKMKVEGKCQK